jgi:hypothetical protein
MTKEILIGHLYQWTIRTDGYIFVAHEHNTNETLEHKELSKLLQAISFCIKEI